MTAEKIGRWFLLGLALIIVLAVYRCTSPFWPAFLEPDDGAPSWAPDSKRIVFGCTRRQWAKKWRFDTPYLGPYSGLDAYKLGEICISDIDGSNRRQLTDNLVADFGPIWSPDGNQIAFVSEQDTSEGTNIHLMQSDGTNLVNLTRYAAGYGQLCWSPDGHTIAFVSNRDNYDWDLYTMATDGSEIVRLTEMGWVSDVSWSPDGNSIFFSGGVGANEAIFTVNVEDGILTQLTDNTFSGFEPAWSPDGRHIAFSSEREDGVQVYVMDIQTRVETRISEGPDLAGRPSWSPDGRFLAYLGGGGLGYNQALYVLDLATEVTTVFSDFQALHKILWSPDSQHLIYERTEDWNEDGFGEVKLWILRVDDGAEWAVSSME